MPLLSFRRTKLASRASPLHAPYLQSINDREKPSKVREHTHLSIHAVVITYANDPYVPSVWLACVTRRRVVACDKASSFRYSDLNAGAIFEREITGVEVAPVQATSGRRGCAADGALDDTKNVAVGTAHNPGEEPENNCSLEFHRVLERTNTVLL
jgi:hypothetical protein